MSRRIALTDIHGCRATFEQMLWEVIELKKADQLYILGDYIDRGPDSKGVFDVIMGLQEEGYHVNCIKGNHEDLMLRARFEPSVLNNWLRNGGDATLMSFGVDRVEDVPERYIKFCEELPLYLILDDFVLVHAGLNAKGAKTFEDFFKDEFGLMWIRYWYGDLNPALLGGRKVIHGHTPTSSSVIKLSLRQDMPIDIDAGCVYSKPGLGHLCAYLMDTHEVVFLPRVDEMVLL